MPEAITSKINGSKLFDERFVSWYHFLHDIVSVVSITFLLAFLLILIFKSPPFMKKLRFYLIFYIFSTFPFQIILMIEPPLLLHPYFYVYPLGLGKYFHVKIQIISYLICFISISATGIAVNSIIWERYFALRNNGNSKIPFCMFVGLLTIVGGVMIGLLFLILYDPIFEKFFVFPNMAVPYLSNHIDGLENITDVKNLIIFKVSSSSMPPLAFVIAIVGGLLISFCTVGCILNYLKSKDLQSQTQMSTHTLKMNEMFRRLILIQVSGFFFFMVIPVAVLAYIYYFVKEPNIYVNLAFMTVSSIELYDACMTCIFVKPYREALLAPFFYVFRFFVKPKPDVASAPSLYSSAIVCIK